MTIKLYNGGRSGAHIATRSGSVTIVQIKRTPKPRKSSVKASQRYRLNKLADELVTPKRFSPSARIIGLLKAEYKRATPEQIADGRAWYGGIA